MPVPNGLNPTFEGPVTAGGFEALHGNGVSITAVQLEGGTAVNIFGTTVNITGVITGLFLTTLGATAQTITIANTDGNVAVLTSADTTGNIVGPGNLLANTALTPSDTFIVSSASDADQSILFVTYKVTGAKVS